MTVFDFAGRRQFRYDRKTLPRRQVSQSAEGSRSIGRVLRIIKARQRARRQSNMPVKAK